MKKFFNSSDFYILLEGIIIILYYADYILYKYYHYYSIWVCWLFGSYLWYWFLKNIINIAEKE